MLTMQRARVHNTFQGFESNVYVLKQFILRYKTVEALLEKLPEKAEKTVSSSSFEKKTLEWQIMVS